MTRNDVTLKRVLKQITDSPDIHFVSDVYQDLGVSKTTFYEKFPALSEEMTIIKETIGINKGLEKRKMRRSWSHSDSAPLQMGLYKLLGTQDERDALNNNESRTKEDTRETEYEVRKSLYE